MQAARRVGYPRRKDKDAAFNDDGDGGAICGGVKFPELGTDTGHSSVCSTRGLFLSALPPSLFRMRGVPSYRIGELRIV